MLAELVQDQEAQRRRRHGRQQQQLLLQQQQLQSGTSPPVQRYASSGHVMAFTASAPHAHVATAAAAAADGSHAYDATAAAAAAAAADGHHDYATNSAAAHLMIDAQRSLPSPPGSGEPSPLQAEIAYGPRSPTQGRRRTLTRIYPASGCGGGPESPTPPAIGRSLSRYARASATSIASANGPASPTAQMGPTAPMRSAALSPERHSPATYVADEYGLDTTESLNTSIFTKAEAEAAVAAAAVIPPPSGTTPPPPPPPGMMGLRVVASAGAACSAAAAPAAAAAATAAAGGGGGGTAGSAAVTASSSIYAAPTPGPASATSGSTRWSAASAQGYSGGSSASASTSTGNSLGSDKSSLGSATCYRSSHTGVSAKAAVDHAVVQRRTLQHVSASVALDAEAAATTKPPPASAAAAPPAAAGAAAAALAHPTGGTEKDAASPAALATPPPPPPAVDPAVQPAPAAAAAPATEQAGSPFATARAVATSVAAVANIEAVAAKPTTATTTKAAAEPVAAAAASAAADAAAIAPVRTRLLPPAYDITPGGPFEAHPVPADGMIFVSHLAPPAMTEDRCGACWATSDFEITRKLHAGYASSVFKATCLVTNTDVVLKAYNLSSLSTFLRHQVLRELDIHARLVHPSVVQLYSTFKEGNLLVLVQEYVRGGSLDRVRRKLGGRMTEFQAMHLVLLPLLNALVYLHGRGIVHRDIKPENLLFTPEWQLKLCDFGVSICLHEERAVTKTGSKEYMAPEVVVCPLKRGPEDNKENEILAYTPAVDVWSLGALMYELLVGFTPFPGGPPARTGGGDPAAQLRFPSSVGEPARAFVRSCLQLHPGDRPTIPQLMKDRWVQIALETQQQQQLQDQQQHAQVPKLLAD
ncbi:hypothetical protein HYH02_004286 [Chlamydomonas schloesseri]|uniref:Protein kinase domain-containing protein n=1 Tax=Chlamydomonas schloesseri TaxID=2026947 RepID=A0A835WP38_9CHLO|nr:hypothetical protein HYH02_004286 [Chlamydomonas schloesseri]|eukprot:KAG2451016.1 hypothetical protein HYH02_004286 [Chlamydomonas schloesseri]